MLKTLSIFLCAIFLIGLTSFEAEAQYQSRGSKNNKHRFNAGVMLGTNLSQMDGDKFTGFDKYGFRGGLKGMMYLNKKIDLTVGLLFSQKGSRFENAESDNFSTEKSRVIHLDYMEVPLLLTYKSLKENGKGYLFDIGFSYARLINYRIKEQIFNPEKYISYEAISEAFNSNEFNFVAGVNYFFTQNLAIGIHYTIQMNKLYNNPNPAPRPKLNVFNPSTTIRKDEVLLLRNYLLGLHLTYHIF